MGDIEHWWCRECGTFDGPKGDDDCTVCFDHDGNYVKVEYLVPSTTHGAVSLLHRTVPYLEDLEKMLGVQGGPGLLARAIEAEFPRPAKDAAENLNVTRRCTGTDDGIHCNHWYDGEPCHWCGAFEYPSVNSARGRLRECVHCGSRTTEAVCDCGYATRWPLEADALRQQLKGAVAEADDLRERNAVLGRANEDLAEQLVRARRALGDHERDRAALERIERKIDRTLAPFEQ